MVDCVFCKIVKGELPCYKIWEDDEHLAFLSPWGNTEAFSVVISKEHYPSYIFANEDEVVRKLTLATKKVSLLIDKAYDDVGRCGMFYEGFGVDHLHSKIFPMHGTGDMSVWKPVESKINTYFKQYPGYLSSHDINERHDDAKLTLIVKKIQQVNIEHG